MLTAAMCYPAAVHVGQWPVSKALGQLPAFHTRQVWLISSVCSHSSGEAEHGWRGLEVVIWAAHEPALLVMANSKELETVLDLTERVELVMGTRLFLQECPAWWEHLHLSCWASVVHIQMCAAVPALDACRPFSTSCPTRIQSWPKQSCWSLTKLQPFPFQW